MNSATTLNVKAMFSSPAAVKERSRSVVKEKYPNYKLAGKRLQRLFPGARQRDLRRRVQGAELFHMATVYVAHKIHNEGQAIVWTGPLEQAELYHSQLIRAGLTMAPLEKA